MWLNGKTLQLGTTNVISFEQQEKPQTHADLDDILRRVNKKGEQQKKFLGLLRPDDLNNATQLYSQATLKRIKFNKLSVLKLLPNPGDYIRRSGSLSTESIEDLCKILGVRLPDHGSHPYLVEGVFLYQDKIATPYLIVSSPIITDFAKVENVFVFPDLFDCIFAQLELWEARLRDKKNKRVVFFQYPGQAYTLYNSKILYDNEFLCNFIDSFLFELEHRLLINLTTQKFKFLGTGYGGNVLLLFCNQLSYLVSSLTEMFPSIKHVMVINSFCHIDDTLRSFMKSFLTELESNNIEDPEFPFYFYSYITKSTKHETKKMSFYEENPISILGRVNLIQGLLKSVSIEKRIQKIFVPMYIVHSLTNCLIDVSHADRFEKVDTSNQKGITVSENNLKRKVIYVPGGHDVFFDNPERMNDLLNKFILKK